MVRAVVKFYDEEYKFDDKEHIQTNIVMQRNPTTSEFLLLEL